jgi:hypothetical protein
MRAASAASLWLPVRVMTADSGESFTPTGALKPRASLTAAWTVSLWMNSTSFEMLAGSALGAADVVAAVADGAARMRTLARAS